MKTDHMFDMQTFSSSIYNVVTQQKKGVNLKVAARCLCISSVFVGSIMREGGDKTLINSLEWKERISLSLHRQNLERKHKEEEKDYIFNPFLSHH